LIGGIIYNLLNCQRVDDIQQLHHNNLYEVEDDVDDDINIFTFAFILIGILDVLCKDMFLKVIIYIHEFIDLLITSMCLLSL